MTDFSIRRPEPGRGVSAITGVVRYLIIGFVLLIIFVMILPFGTVGAGERAVLLRFNAVTGKVLGEGLYFNGPSWSAS